MPFLPQRGCFRTAGWAIIPLLILAFLLIDAFGHKLTGNALLAFVCGMLGVGALMTVPAVFTGALALMERPQLWPVFAAAGFGPQAPPGPPLALALPACAGRGAGAGRGFPSPFFHQGPAPQSPHAAPLAVVEPAGPAGSGPGAAAHCADELERAGADQSGRGRAGDSGRAAGAAAHGTTYGARPALLALLPVVFAAMLTGRQLLQDAALAPMHDTAVAAREARAAALAPFSQKALENFALKLRTVYDNGDTIYDGACAPCHGLDGRGQGPEARHLRIPAADLAAHPCGQRLRLCAHPRWRGPVPVCPTSDCTTGKKLEGVLIR